MHFTIWKPLLGFMILRLHVPEMEIQQIAKRTLAARPDHAHKHGTGTYQSSFTSLLSKFSFPISLHNVGVDPFF